MFKQSQYCLERFRKSNREEANFDLLYLSELEKDLSSIDKIQKVAILSNGSNCILLSKRSN